MGEGGLGFTAWIREWEMSLWMAIHYCIVFLHYFYYIALKDTLWIIKTYVIVNAHTIYCICNEGRQYS